MKTILKSDIRSEISPEMLYGKFRMIMILQCCNLCSSCYLKLVVSVEIIEEKISGLLLFNKKLWWIKKA